MNRNNESNSSSNGIGFCGLLTIVFITLKLTRFIDWSWWWVLAPSWIPLSLVLVVAIIYIVFKLSIHILKIIKYNKRLKEKVKRQGDNK